MPGTRQQVESSRERRVILWSVKMLIAPPEELRTSVSFSSRCRTNGANPPSRRKRTTGGRVRTSQKSKASLDQPARNGGSVADTQYLPCARHSVNLAQQRS